MKLKEIGLIKKKSDPKHRDQSKIKIKYAEKSMTFSIFIKTIYIILPLYNTTTL